MIQRNNFEEIKNLELEFDKTHGRKQAIINIREIFTNDKQVSNLCITQYKNSGKMTMLLEIKKIFSDSNKEQENIINSKLQRKTSLGPEEEDSTESSNHTPYKAKRIVIKEAKVKCLIPRSPR